MLPRLRLCMCSSLVFSTILCNATKCRFPSADSRCCGLFLSSSGIVTRRIFRPSLHREWRMRQCGNDASRSVRRPLKTSRMMITCRGGLLTTPVMLLNKSSVSPNHSSVASKPHSVAPKHSRFASKPLQFCLQTTPVFPLNEFNVSSKRLQCFL